MKFVGLQIKLCIPIAFIVTLLFGFYGYFSYNQKKDQLYDDSNFAEKRVKDRLLTNIVVPLDELDDETIQAIIKSELEERFINAIVITDDEKKNIVYGLKKNDKNKFEEVEDIAFYKSESGFIIEPIWKFDDGQKNLIGFLFLVVDRNKIKERLNQELITLITAILILNFIIITFIYYFLKSYAVKPLENLSKISERMSIGDFSKRVPSIYTRKLDDEIALLSNSMNLMANELEKLTTNLKNEVFSQTKEIQLKNENFNNLLSNLDQGFLIIGPSGIITDESTQMTQDIFGIDPKGNHITDLFKFNLTEKKGYIKWLAHVFKGKIPFKDLLSLTPKQIQLSDGKFISLSYRAVYQFTEVRQVEKLICILNDITEEKRVQETIQKANEKSKMILKLIDEPIEFIDLLSDLELSINNFLNNPKVCNYEDLFRSLHTLKARCASYNISILVEKIHVAEGVLFKLMDYKKKIAKSETLLRGKLDTKDMEKIKKDLEFFVYDLGEALKTFLKENRNIIELAQNCTNTGNKIEELHSAKNELIHFYEKIGNKFIHKNIKDSFNQYLRPIDELSKSQDKNVKVLIGESNISIKIEPYKDLLSSLHHVFRNSIDHGIEQKEERIATNKDEQALIEVIFKNKGNYCFQIAIRDDGRGIDPSRIKEIAQKSGLRKSNVLEEMKEEDIIQLIFEPGFSSKEKASQISGRGIGMDAVKKCVNELEGKVWAKSTLGEGTLFILELPIIK